MAKGDAKRAQDQVKAQASMTPQYQQNFVGASDRNMGTYDEVMQGYRDFMAPGGGSSVGGGGGSIGANSYGGYKNLANGPGFGWDPLFRGAMKNAIGGYNEFAETGGFSPQAIQDIRARGVAPMRATYANAQSDLDRSRSLTGGGSNYAASAARMAREQGYGLSDQMTDINAGIAQMVQQGRLAGLGGLSQTGAAGQGLSTNIDSLNLQGMLAGLAGMTGIDAQRAAASRASGAASSANQLAALRGMTDMYGTNPALLNVTGNQQLGHEQNMMAGELGASQLPSNFDTAMGRIGQVGGLVGNVAGAFGGLDGGGSSLAGLFGGGTPAALGSGLTGSGSLAGNLAGTYGANYGAGGGLVPTSGAGSSALGTIGSVAGPAAAAYGLYKGWDMAMNKYTGGPSPERLPGQYISQDVYNQRYGANDNPYGVYGYDPGNPANW